MLEDILVGLTMDNDFLLFSLSFSISARKKFGLFFKIFFLLPNASFCGMGTGNEFPG